MKRRILLLVLGLIILGSVAPYLFAQSIRLDEAQTIWVVTKPFQTVLYLIAGDVHVPLYFTIMHIWVTIFGNSVISARMPSFLFYIATLFVLYKLCKESSNRNVAYLTVVFFSFSPFVLWYSFEARMYTQFVFFSCLSSLYFLRMLRSGAKSGTFGFLISAILGVYTHYFFLFLLFSQGVYLLIAICNAGRQDELSLWQSLKADWKLFAAFMVIAVLSVASLTPWVWYVVSLQSAANSDPLIAPPSSFNIFQTFAFFLFGFQSPVTQGLIVALWPLIIVLLFFVFTLRRKMNARNLTYFEIVTFLPIVMFILVSFVRPIFLARYLIFTVPTLFFILSSVLLTFPRRIARALIAVLFITILGFLVYQNLSPSTPVKENYKGVAAYLSEQTTPADIVAISAPFTIYPIEYSYSGRARLDTIPAWNRFERGPMEAFSSETLQQRMEKYQQVYHRIFVVLSYDQGYEDELRSYMETHYHRLDQRDFSPGLEVRVYQLRYL